MEQGTLAWNNATSAKSAVTGLMLGTTESGWPDAIGLARDERSRLSMKSNHCCGDDQMPKTWDSGAVGYAWAESKFRGSKLTW